MPDPEPKTDDSRVLDLPPAKPSLLAPVLLSIVALGMIPLNISVFFQTSHGFGPDKTPFVVFALVQTVCGGAACFLAARKMKLLPVRGALLAVLGATLGGGGPVGLLLAWWFWHLDFGGPGGSGWGRPLRLRGRVLHPALRTGSDWTRGASPDATALDAPTRAALEALWLHDAQKEHASVPALARVSWLLAAVGAPADLVEAVHVAVLEEIEHARLCFALAAGYGGRSHTVLPMPELLVGGLDLHGDPLVRIAVESINDGCLLEDFNADVARACARACLDATTRDVLDRITREERSHAELSWRLLEFALARGGAPVERAVSKALAALDRTPRPTAVSNATSALAARANPDAMRAHGRLPDAEWGALWTVRLAETRKRLEAMLSEARQTEGSVRMAS